MNEEEPINEYKDTYKLKFNLTGKPIPGSKTFDELRQGIDELTIEIDEWCNNANK
jgi:hypothetical protein